VTHPSQAELQDYVLGMAEPKDADLLRRHVSSCPVCALRLHDEARFELLIQDVARGWDAGPVPKAKAQWLRAWRPAWLSATVLAVCLGLWFYTSRYEPMPITAQDTYAPRDYCLFIGGQADRVELEMEFPDSAANRADIRP